ncbi:MAG TPA: hypothetical protein VIN10_07015 [Bacteroidales bacterium]
MKKIEQDKRTENQIIKFKEKLYRLKTHPELKSGDETMSVDSAVWYIEATANYTYGDASYESSKFTIDSSVISIALTNNEILLADVQVAYEKAIDSIAAQYYNIDSDEKQLIVADISIKEVNDENVILYITSGIGSTQDCGLGLTNTYPWYWGWELGRCDGSGLGVGCDAADKIAQLANYEVAVPVGGTYYTDVSYEHADGCDYTNDNGDCLLFADFQEYTLVHQCLSTTEITFYKNGLKTVGNILKPSGKSVIRYSLIDLTAFALCGDPNYQQHDCWYMVHYATIKYGIWHTGGGGGSL